LPGNHIKVLLEELNIMGGDGNEANIECTQSRVVRSTLYDARKQLQVLANPNNKNLVGIATIEMLCPTCPSPKSLPTLSERGELQGMIACFRDKNNNGMMRNEMILFVMDFTGCCKWKQAENHLDSLIRTDKVSNLKRGG